MIIKKFIEYIFELKKEDLKGTYLKNDEETNLELENRLKSLIDKSINIENLIKIGDENFIKIKNLIQNDKELLNRFRNDVDEPIYKEGLKKWIETFIKKYYCNIQKENRPPNKQYEIDFKLMPENSSLTKNAHIANGKINDTYRVYQIIFPKEINDFLDKNNDFNKLDKFNYLTLEYKNLNRVHFVGRQAQNWNIPDKLGLPHKLRGKGLAVSIYKSFINKLRYLTSSTSSSTDIRKVWEKILSDSSFLSIICNHDIIVFSKSFKNYDEIVKKFLTSKICTKDKLKIDSELESKLGDWYKDWKNKLVDILYYENNLEKLIKKYKSYKLTEKDVQDIKNHKKYFIVYIPDVKKIGVICDSNFEKKEVDIQYLDSGKYYDYKKSNFDSFNILEIKNINFLDK